jgi:membrane-associated phospholipid phosphatase
VAKNVKAPLLACLGCAGALIALVIVAYKLGPVEHLDATLLAKISSPAGTGREDGLADGFAHLADPLPLIAMLAAIVVLALAAGRRREALAVVAVVAGANLTTQVLKVLLAHPRYEPFLGFHQPSPTAFPSGHATAATSIAVALLLTAPRRLRPLALLAGTAFVGLISISLLVAEWHYPSDVLGGILVAAGWGFAAVAALRLVARRDRAPEAQASSRFAISMK